MLITVNVAYTVIQQYFCFLGIDAEFIIGAEFLKLLYQFLKGFYRLSNKNNIISEL